MADTDLIIPNEEPSSSDANVCQAENGHHEEDEEKITIRHPNHLLQKFVALMLMCLLGFGKCFLMKLHIFCWKFCL